MQTGQDAPQKLEGFGVIWSTIALDQVVFAMVLPILPLIASDYGASALTVTALVAVFSLSQFLISPFVGALSDRIGRKPIIVISLLGSALGSLILGWAGTLPLLFLGRAVDGLSGTAFVSAQAAITDLVAPKLRAKYLGLLGTAFAAGFVVGPALTAVSARFNDRLPFFIAAGLGLANAVAAMFRFPETNVVNSDSPEAHGLNEDTSPLSGFRYGASIGRSTWFYIAIMSAGLLAFATVEGGTFTLFAAERGNLNETSIALVFVWLGIVLAIVQGFAVGRLNARLSVRSITGLSLAISGIGFVVLAAAGQWVTMVIAITLVSMSQGAMRPTLTAAVTNAAPEQMRGRAIGVKTSAQALVRIVGPLIAGALYMTMGPSAPFVAGAAISLLTLAIVAGTSKHWVTQNS